MPSFRAQPKEQPSLVRIRDCWWVLFWLGICLPPKYPKTL
jgi:hypothetical protein